MGMNINDAYKFIQFVASKESRGWISPAEFNLAAELAQLTLYSEKEAEFMATKKIGADMLPFSVSAEVTPAAGKIAYPTSPDAFRHLLSVYNATTFKRYDELTQAELADAMRSKIVTPTASYPAIVQREDFIYIYPTTVVDVSIIEFLKRPTTPEWAYTIESSRPVYDAGNSNNFDFDQILFLELAMRILQHVGVNIKDTEVAQYGMSFNNKAQ